MENKADTGLTNERLLARFIRLCSAALSAPGIQESAALIVNRISEIVRTDRAVLTPLNQNQAIVAVSGGGLAAQDNAFADAVEDVRRRYSDRIEPVIVPRVHPNQFSPHLSKVQQAMGGTNILWLPLRLNNDRNTVPEFALWLERWNNQAWEKPEIDMLRHAALFFGHALTQRKAPRTRSGKRMFRIAAALTVLIFLILPVSSSVTAPMRVSPDQPYHVFAPMDGILKELFVQPGQKINADEVVFKYDARVLDKRLEEAYRNVAVAKAKLIRLEGAAYRDPEARAELPAQKLEVERAEADVEFFAAQKARAEVKTAKAGIVVLDDPDALIGASLQTGQLVLSVADPSKTKLKLTVPASDAGFLKQGARVEVRLDSNPLKSLNAEITRIGFDVKLSEDHIPSVLAEAAWDSKTPIPEVQPGQKGTAKIYGSSVSLGMQILRKPIIRLRMLTGL